mmetsp:Transcript_755/g.1213  ORF Transcript_755/g.1213 Transcript_755/m.1213 type:complete len:97 (+) Transcript_755:1229-1519(+)
MISSWRSQTWFGLLDDGVTNGVHSILPCVFVPCYHSRTRTRTRPAADGAEARCLNTVQCWSTSIISTSSSTSSTNHKEANHFKDTTGYRIQDTAAV